MGKLAVFNRFLEISAYKYGYFSTNIVEKKKCQNPFPAILRRKEKVLITKPRGGGAKGLS